MTSCQVPKASSPCPYFLKCGGCDFLDLEKKDYQDLKKDILQKSLGNIMPAKIDWIWVDAGSRRKVIFQVDSENKLGFFTKETNKIVEIDSCFVAQKEISELIPLLKKFLKNQERNFYNQISTTLFDNGLDLIFFTKKEPSFIQIKKLTDFAQKENFNISYCLKKQSTPIFLARKNQIFYPDFKINLDCDIFIQATKMGLENIIKIIRTNLGLAKNIVDIYAGFGAYSFAIQDLVKSITAFEGDEKMVDSLNKNAAKNNLSNKIKAQNCDLFSNPITKNELNYFDLAIINPPRNGASPQILEIAKSSLKKIIYVSCNPQSFRRDAKIMIDSNFKITKLFALDQFYATKHLEIIAIFEKI